VGLYQRQQRAEVTAQANGHGRDEMGQMLGERDHHQRSPIAVQTVTKESPAA
jgi:hypothetical protein